MTVSPTSPTTPIVRTITRIIPAEYRRLLWPLAFALILIGGFILAGTGYNHGLPYIDTGDEMTIWTMGRAYIDPTWTLYQPQYPPGLPFVSATIQRLQIMRGDPFINVGKTVEIMRLLAVIATTIALAIIMLLARRLGGAVAGITAGLFWMVLPLANALAKEATANAFLSTWFIASIALGIEGYYRRSIRWIAASLILGIAATLFKWQSAAALGMAGMASLSLWRTDHRRMIIILAIYAVIVGIFSYWAVFIHGALDSGVYLPGTTTTAPTPAMVIYNMQYLLSAFGPPLIFAVLPLTALILSVILPNERRWLHKQMGLWMLPVVIIVYIFVLSFNGAPVFGRHYLAALTVVCVLAGVGVVLPLRLAKEIAYRFRQPILTILSKGLAVTLGVAILIPWHAMLDQSRAIAADLSRPDTRTYFAEWARATTEGPLLITEPTVAAAVQTLYGYRGRPIETPYNQGTSIYVQDHEVTQDLIDAKGIRYIIAGADFKGERLTTPITRLITLRPGGIFRGVPWAAFYVGALPLLNEPVTFGGEVLLRGMALSKQSVCPGEPLDMQLFWGAARTPTLLYSAYVHLFSEKSGEFTIPLGGPPAGNNRPTISWISPDEVLLGPQQIWTAPTDLAPGDYQIWIGVFEPIADSRLKLPDGADRYVAGTIQVRNCTRN